MDSFFPRFKNVLFLITLLLAQTVGLAIQVRRPVETGEPDSRQVTLARSWVVGAVTPFERATAAVSHGVRSTWSNYLDLRGARQQNRALHEQIAQLRVEEAAIAEDALQGHRLQALLAFQQHYVASTVAAQVVGTSGSEMSRVLYLDKGAADGLRPDMAVITPDGIVGKIRDVFPQTAPHTAQVLLINDQTSGAGVILVDTRLRAVIRGTAAGLVQIGNLTADDRIKPGQMVLTSGGDQIYPRGLPVGTVESVAPDPDHPPYTAIRIRPAANLFQIEEVLVITGVQSSLPRTTLEALNQGAATTAAARAAAQRAAAARAAAAEQELRDENARNAAEIVADRLPSLHDPAIPNQSAEAAAKEAAEDALHPKSAGGTVPKPLPTVHSDRYSPGTTPRADELKPGAPRQLNSSGPDAPAAGGQPPQ